ncbi:TraX family protein [Paenibacillus chitinolyticus]
MKQSILFQNGINSFQMKCLGIFFMTLDHIERYVIKPSVGYGILTVLGRIAAPLFLFILIKSVHFTRSKLKLAIRLYIAHVVISLFTIFLSYFKPNWFGGFPQIGILATFAYTVLFIYIIERVISSIKNKKIVATCFNLTSGVVFVIIPFVLLFGLSNINGEIINSVVPNILTVEYSPLFILMGICWYFFKGKKSQVVVLVTFSILSLVGTYFINHSNIWLFAGFFNNAQFWMILFFPLLLLYNENKGRSFKYFFYFYYPLHIYLLMFIGAVIK